jgi:CRP-like cAMP-binding protein
LDLLNLLSTKSGEGLTLIQENPDMSLELIRVLSRRLRETNVRLTAASKSRPRVLERLFDDLSETGELGPMT